VLEEWKVRTNLDHDRLRDRSPAKIGQEANIRNSFIQNGCEIDGEVVNSILFPGVKIKKGAVVKNSIIFSDNLISFDATLDHTITDFDVTVGAGTRIGSGKNSKNTTHSELGITLIGKGTTIPRDIEIGKDCVINHGLTEKHFLQKEYKSGSTL
jgi:glucose-1-phosphate adenylyltransferase